MAGSLIRVAKQEGYNWAGEVPAATVPPKQVRIARRGPHWPSTYRNALKRQMIANVVRCAGNVARPSERQSWHPSARPQIAEKMAGSTRRFIRRRCGSGCAPATQQLSALFTEIVAKVLGVL